MKHILYPRFVQLILKAKQSILLPHTRTIATPCLQQKVFQNMTMSTQGWNGEERPLSDAMLSFLTQVQGAGSVNPTDPQITPIAIPSVSYTPALTQT